MYSRPRHPQAGTQHSDPDLNVTDTLICMMTVFVHLVRAAAEGSILAWCWT